MSTVYRLGAGLSTRQRVNCITFGLFRKLVSHARIELATLYRQSHPSGPRHVSMLILLTERKNSARSHPSRHALGRGAGPPSLSLTACVIQFTKIIHVEVLARASAAVLLGPSGLSLGDVYSLSAGSWAVNSSACVLRHICRPSYVYRYARARTSIDRPRMSMWPWSHSKKLRPRCVST